MTEGVQEDKITVTGNTVIDALHIVVDKIKTDGALQQELAGVLEKRVTIPHGLLMARNSF